MTPSPPLAPDDASPAKPTRATLSSVLGLLVCLREDAADPAQRQRARDAELAPRWSALPTSEAGRRAAGAALLEVYDSPPLRDALRRTQSFERRTLGLAVLIGLFLGFLSTRGLLRYDGTQPVNVLGPVLVFAMGNAALLALTLLGTGPFRGILQGLTEGLNPGRLPEALAGRWLGRDDAVPGAGGPRPIQLLVSGEEPALRGVRGAWLMLLSQAMGVALHTAALLATLHLVLLTDLAFGWATTLEVTGGQFAGLVKAMAWPWSWAWPGAQPDLSTVEAGRYFRGQPFDPEPRQAWWRWLLMVMVVYGWVPRVAMLVWSTHRYRRSLREAMSQAPGLTQRLSRVAAAAGAPRQPLNQAAPAKTSPSNPRSAEAEAGLLAEAKTRVVIRWAGALGDDNASPGFDVGGSKSLHEDSQTVEAVAQAIQRQGGHVRLIVKAWEPPLAECRDFLAQLRSQLPEACLIEISPITSEPSETGPSEVWSRVVSSWALPGVMMQPGPSEGARDA